MKTRLLLSSLLIALSASSFAQTHKAHWSYNGKESPEIDLSIDNKLLMYDENSLMRYL